MEKMLGNAVPKEPRAVGRHPRRVLPVNKLFNRLESRSLSELTRQITPPTKNGHAPPPTESRKSYQSVNLFKTQRTQKGLTE